MFPVLLALFIGLPVLEIWLLISLGGEIGLLPTVAVCIVTGVVGAWLARAQGGHLLGQVQARVARGEVPAREMIDGLMIVVAGVLLMTPGFVTDALGVALLLPPVRALVRHSGQAALARRAEAAAAARSRGGFQFFYGDFGGFSEPERRRPEPEVRVHPDVEFLPPGQGPRPPRRERPPIIDVE